MAAVAVAGLPLVGTEARAPSPGPSPQLSWRHTQVALVLFSISFSNFDLLSFALVHSLHRFCFSFFSSILVIWWKRQCRAKRRLALVAPFLPSVAEGMTMNTTKNKTNKKKRGRRKGSTRERQCVAKNSKRNSDFVIILSHCSEFSQPRHKPASCEAAISSADP